MKTRDRTGRGSIGSRLVEGRIAAAIGGALPPHPLAEVAGNASHGVRNVTTATPATTPAAKVAVPTTPKKPGVFLCQGCGIGEAVQADALEKVVRSELKVAHCVKHAVLCSEEGVAEIRSAAPKWKLSVAL